MARARLVVNPLSGPLLRLDGSRRTVGWEPTRPISLRLRAPYHSLARGCEYTFGSGVSWSRSTPRHGQTIVGVGSPARVVPSFRSSHSTRSKNRVPRDLYNFRRSRRPLPPLTLGSSSQSSLKGGL